MKIDWARATFLYSTMSEQYKKHLESTPLKEFVRSDRPDTLKIATEIINEKKE